MSGTIKEERTDAQETRREDSDEVKERSTEASKRERSSEREKVYLEGAI